MRRVTEHSLGIAKAAGNAVLRSGGLATVRRLPVDPRQRSRVDGELRGVQHLDARVLFAVERRDDRLSCSWLTALVERELRAVEPQAQVELVGGRERRGAPQ